MKNKTDVVLVKPGGRVKTFGELGPSISGFAPPLDIGILASIMRDKGYSVKIIDADAEFLTSSDTVNRITEYDPFLVAIFSHTIRMTHAGETIKELQRKAPQIKTLLGGRHPSALPEKTLLEERPDFVCQGEAFQVLPGLMQLIKEGKTIIDKKILGIWYLKNGEIISNPPAPLIKKLDELPFIAWDLLPMDKYRAHNWHCFENLEQRQPYAILYTSLGCPFNCTFCCVNATYGGSGIRQRSPEKVVAELDYLIKNYKVKNIRIVDDLFTFKPEHVMRICDLIIERNYDLNIWAYARVDTVTEPMLNKMKQAGIRWVCYGIEAGSQKVREGVYKRINLDKITKGIEMTRKAGLYINANFIFGLPDDDIKTMRETLNMAKMFLFEYVNFYVAMAWPGSKLYDESIQKGVRLPENWNGYAQLSEETLPLPTKYLSASEVLRFRDNAFIEYFSNPSYLLVIEQKFGLKVVEHIKDMLKHKLHRKYD